MMKRYFLSLFAVAGILASCAKDPAVSGTAPGGGNERNEEEYVGDVVKGKIRIRLADNATALRTGAFTRGEADSGDPELDKLAAQLGATKIERVFGTDPRFTERHKKYGLHLWYDVTFDEDVPVSRAQSGFESLPGVAYVRPIYRIYPADGYDTLYPAAVTDKSGWEGSTAEMPFDDPGLPMQWHYYNDGTLFNTEGTVVAVEGADVNLFKAWEMYGAGDPSVVVAVMDMGIQYDHPDLVANMWVNEGELNGEPNKDNDGNGIKNDIYGYNGLTRDGNIEPGSHGTHVAGTVAATNNNGIGVSGVAGGTGEGDGVRLMSCQVFDTVESGKGAEAYLYAADNGAVISQNSWVYNNMAVLPQDMSDAFDYFIENAGMDDTDGDGVNDVQTGPMAGGIIIFAAGNAGGPTLLPAASDKVIAVAASGPNYEKGSYSSCGPEIDILAPGGAGSQGGKGNVLSTYKDSYTGEVGYSHLWGTSMACPHVSGVAALIVSHFGGEGFTAEECKKRLLNGYRPMGGLIPDDQLGDIGVGLLDAAAALMDDPGTAPANVDDAEVSSELNKINLTWTVPADGNGAAVATYWVTYGAEGEEPVEQEIRNLYNVGTEVTYALDGKYNTAYDISIQTEDRWGNRTTEAKELSVTLGTFENVAPTVMEKIGDSNIAAPGEENIRQYTLSDYFTDRNLSDGDVLAYTASSSNEAVVAVSVAEDILTLTPKAKGSANITVTATDLAGASAELKFRVSVTSGPAPGQAVSALTVTENPVGDALGFSLSEASGATVDVTVYDAAARKIYGGSVTLDTNGAGSVDAAAWSPGAYTLAVVHGNQTLKASFVKR
mgnify:CR=1 FL=1